MGCASSKSSPPWTTPSSLKNVSETDLAWFKGAIRNHPELGPHCSNVTSVKVEELMGLRADGTEVSDGGGISGSSIKRVHITYASSSSSGSGVGDAPPPSSLVLKFSDFTKVELGFLSRLLGELGGFRLTGSFRTEDRFFNEFQPLTDAVGLRTVKAYHASLDDGVDACGCCFVCCNNRAPVRSTLLLEDLAAYYSFAPFADIPTANARLIFSNMARLHGSFWGAEGMAKMQFAHPFAPWCAFQFGLKGAGAKKKRTIPDRPKTFDKIFLDTNKKGGWPVLTPCLNEERVKECLKEVLGIEP